MTTSANFFTSLDGTDENGKRAEVYVQSFSGTVKDIKENTDKKVADVHFSVGNLKFPIHGWINIEEPVYDLAKTAYESGDEVTFRIETQRKTGVDRSIPMEELRKDSSTARDNVKVLLVAVNDLRTSEAVTNPKEDPKGTNGRYVAGDDDISTPASSSGGGSSISKEAALEALTNAAASPEARSTILDSLAAQVLLHGATVEEVNIALAGNDKRENGTNLDAPRAAYAQEAPAWKEYNSDGRLNLGATAVAAGVGVETLVTKQLHALSLSRTSNIEEVTDYFTNIVFAIADRVQVAVYGNGARVDRAANSHTRIRGILYEVIEKDSPFPLVLGDNNNIEAQSPDALKQWIAETGKRTITKFKRAITASQAHPGFGGLVPPASLLGNAPQNAPVAPTSPAQPSSPARPSSPVTAPVSEMSQEEKMAIARAAALPQPTQDYSAPASPVESSVAASPVVEHEGVMPPRDLSDDEKAGEKASPDTVQSLKELMFESGLDPQDKGDLVAISHLLGYTFGKEYTNPNSVPDEALIEFIDWYAGNGSEALNNALKISREQ